MGSPINRENKQEGKKTEKRTETERQKIEEKRRKGLKVTDL